VCFSLLVQECKDLLLSAGFEIQFLMVRDSVSVGIGLDSFGTQPSSLGRIQEALDPARKTRTVLILPEISVSLGTDSQKKYASFPTYTLWVSEVRSVKSG
jgi:hypothetical protein